MKPAIPFLAVAVMVGGAGLMLQAPLPGDVALTRALQDLLGTRPDWARWLTGTAKMPLLLGTVVVAAGLAGLVGGWRAAAGALFAHPLALSADALLRALIHMPRPDPALVAVAAPAPSSGLPSTFGLYYGVLFGLALLARGGGRWALPVRLAAGALLIAGAAARIVLGGHWPSQMLASTALGLALTVLALEVAGKVEWPRRGKG